MYGREPQQEVLLENRNSSVRLCGSCYRGCLAEIGHDVTCTDNDMGKIQTLQQGLLPIYEPHLDEIGFDFGGRLTDRRFRRC